jgi:hypothetical protein
MRTLAAAFRESSDGVDHGVEPDDEGRSSHQLLRVGLIGTAPRNSKTGSSKPTREGSFPTYDDRRSSPA